MITLARTATITLIALTVLHLLVAAGVISPDHVGGGRYPDERAARVGESLAAVLTAAFAWVTAARGGWLRRPRLRTQRVVLWIMAGIFTLSTLGSIAGATLVERTALAATAAGLTIAAVILAIGSRRPAPSATSERTGSSSGLKRTATRNATVEP